VAPNKIRAFREAAGLTQRELASKAKTSQQQIQRLETGIHSARFDLAVRICEALGAPMKQVFPRAAKALEKASRKTKPDTKRLEEDMAGAGIDMDPAHWFFKFRLRGGVEDILPISSSEKKHLWSAVQRIGSDSPFVIFDSNDRRIVLNLNHLLFCQFLFEPPDVVFDPAGEKEKDDDQLDLRIDFAAGGAAQWFGIEPDEAPLSDERATERMQQFQHMLFMLEHSVENDEVFNFEDSDGEHVFFRGADVAMLSIPLWGVEPDLSPIEDEEGDAHGKQE
jgi:transcriptional regulator with XRE-family HTH domain